MKAFLNLPTINSRVWWVLFWKKGFHLILHINYPFHFPICSCRWYFQFFVMIKDLMSFVFTDYFSCFQKSEYRGKIKKTIWQEKWRPHEGLKFSSNNFKRCIYSHRFSIFSPIISWESLRNIFGNAKEFQNNW